MSALDRLDEVIRGFNKLSPADQVEIIGSLNKTDRDALVREAVNATKHLKFIPNLGPQALAYRSLASVLLYGGEAGGGKSGLGVGVAINEHHYSLLMRRQFVQLDGLTKIAIAYNGNRSGFVGGNRPLLRLDGGRSITFGANQHIGDEQDYQGNPYDYKYFDEACQFAESQIRFHLAWIRLGPGVKQTQRRRAILGTNPPLDAEGEWIVGMFRPWLDDTYHRPAEDGELRWFISDEDGKDFEVDGPAPVESGGRTLIPESRTFIRAHLSDNPYLIRDNEYQAKLDAMPEPTRTIIRDGKFMVARPDADKQIIPTAWILAAQQRWKPDGWRQYAMTALAVDPAGGGADAQEIMVRHGPWFGPPITRTGPETADGARMCAEVLTHRRNGCPIVVDVGGGYGGQIILRLTDNKIEAHRFNGGAKATGVTRDGSKLAFYDKRSESLWRVREALDPSQDGGSVVELPPDPELRSDLAAPTFELTSRGIKAESKDELRVRLGRSTGKGDACMMCLSEGDRAVRRQIAGQNRGPLPTRANTDHMAAKRRYA